MTHDRRAWGQTVAIRNEIAFAGLAPTGQRSRSKEVMAGQNNGNSPDYYNTSRTVQAASRYCFGFAAVAMIGAYALDFSHGYLAVPFSISSVAWGA